MIPFRHRDKERGATLIEASICYVLLFMALFAVIEFGLAFKDWLSVSNASREGARAAATFGNDPTADIQILRNVEGTMATIGFESGDRVRIYKANDATKPGNPFVYRPGTNCDFQPGFEFLAGTCCDWEPCPEPGRPAYNPVNPLWGFRPTTRDVSAPNTDRIGVEIVFEHQWITGLFASTTDFTTATEFQIEPQVFENTP